MKTSFTMDFFSYGSIKPEHVDLPIRQIYAWAESLDKKIILVSKDGEKWQFPGGKPHEGESHEDTLVRELREEAGVNLNPARIQPRFLGYYHVKELDGDKVVDEFLQLRYYTPLNKQSNELSLQSNEHEAEDIVVHAEFVTLDEACKRISWLGESKERQAFMNLANMYD